jgi:hypothetical protein
MVLNLHVEGFMASYKVDLRGFKLSLHCSRLSMKIWKECRLESLVNLWCSCGYRSCIVDACSA